MIAVPQSTVEKPLTTIDYIAVMARAATFEELTDYAASVPPHVVEDDRFARAFKVRLDEIKGKR